MDRPERFRPPPWHPIEVILDEPPKNLTQLLDHPRREIPSPFLER